jgi:hypothetical protein
MAVREDLGTASTLSAVTVRPRATAPLVTSI